VVLVVLTVGVAAQQFDAMDRVDYDPDGARERLEAQRFEGVEGVEPDRTVDADVAVGVDRDDGLLTTLVLGSDARDDDTSARADAIMLVVIPPDEPNPSSPRSPATCGSRTPAPAG
jgi:hypothetical protein